MNTATKYSTKYPRSLAFKFVQSIILTGILLSASESVFACQGGDYTRTLQITNQSLQLGLEFGTSGNINLFMQRLQELSRLAQQLPPSCQLLLQQMGGSFSGGSSSTNCMGGVCCDSTGCY